MPERRRSQAVAGKPEKGAVSLHGQKSGGVSMGLVGPREVIPM
jgi:hypothetical protein